jgi:TonB-linked SusC/RagA family outer membrane protein
MRKMLSLLMGAMLFVVIAGAQTRTVTGKITDNNGAPIPYVSVKIKGSSQAVVGDDKGVFKINAPATATLVFSATGFANREAKADKTTLAVSLGLFVSPLEEVVVTAAGTSSKRKEQGYNSSTIKAGELTAAKPTNLASGLSGKVPGLLVSATGGGVNPSYRLILRGQRSLLGNNTALVVLDNVIVPSAMLGNINPEDIEDIQVLNGAGAVALYGSDASNGALLITTKKGRKGFNQVKVSNTLTLEHTAFLPKTQNQFGQGGNGYGVDANGNPGFSPVENQAYGPKFDGSIVNLGVPLADGSQFTTTYSYKDDWKKFWQTGQTNQSDFSITSGDDVSTLFFSAQYVDVKGTTPNDKFNRASVRLNGTRKVTNQISAQYNIYYIQNRYDITSATASVYNNLLNMPTNVPVLQFKDWQNNKFANPNGYYNPWYLSPYFTVDNNRQNTRNDYLNGALSLKYAPAKWLDFTLKTGFTTQNASTKSWTGKFTYTAFAKASSGGSKTDIAGGVTENPSYNSQLTTDFQIGLNKKVGDFSFTGLIAAALRQNVGKNTSTSISGLVLPGLYNLSNSLNLPTSTSTDTKTRQQAIYGEFKAGFRNYLYLHITGRNDWVSVLDPNNQSFFYPAADLSFIATDAIKALRNIKGLDYLKVRGGVSKVGNVNVGAYSLLPTFGQANGYPYNGTAGYTVGNQVVATGLKPEFTKGWETGIDLSLFKGFADASATIYNTHTTNQTVPVSVSSATGYTSYLFNTGETANNGIETRLSLTPIRSKNLTISTGINYTHNNNQVISINSALPQLAIGGNSYAIPGYAFPVIFGTDYLRDPQGRVIVDPITGLPGANPTPVILGNASVKDIFSVDVNVAYKGFHFYAQMEYRGGNKVYQSQGPSEDWAGSSIRTVQYNRQRFVFPNSVYMDANGKYVPNTSVVIQNGNGNDGFWTDATHNMNIVSNYVTSGAFWKLRQVSIAYDLPAALLKKTHAIKGATISLQGRNLFVILPKSNIYTDPEYSSNDGTNNGNGIGVTGLQSPPSRFYGGTITLTF